MPIDFIISMAASVILSTIKNPAVRAQVESVMYKIYSQIEIAFPQFYKRLHPDAARSRAGRKPGPKRRRTR